MIGGVMDLISGAAVFLAALLQSPQETGRPVLKDEDYKAITEKNIFSPLKPKKEPRKETKNPKKGGDPPPKLPEPPRVAAFADFNGEWRVLIRDQATSQSKWYKVGESVSGGVVQSIDMLNLTLKFASDAKTYHNGDALPLANGKAAIPLKPTPAVLSMEAVSAAPAESPENRAKTDEVRARLKKDRAKKVEDDDPDSVEETTKPDIKKKKD